MPGTGYASPPAGAAVLQAPPRAQPQPAAATMLAGAPYQHQQQQHLNLGGDNDDVLSQLLMDPMGTFPTGMDGAWG
jgi:hypothetical protein